MWLYSTLPRLPSLTICNCLQCKRINVFTSPSLADTGDSRVTFKSFREVMGNFRAMG